MNESKDWTESKGETFLETRKRECLSCRTEQQREHWGIQMCVCARLSTCEGSVTLSVTTSSLVYLIKRWCSSNSCIFHILNLLSWSKNWKNLTTKKREHHLTRKWDGASTHRGVSVSQCWKSQVLGEEWHNTTAQLLRCSGNSPFHGNISSPLHNSYEESSPVLGTANVI